MSGLEPVWVPDEATVAAANVTAMMRRVGAEDVAGFHRWTVDHRPEFWAGIVERLGIVLDTPYEEILDLSDGVERPRWLAGARLNIVESCFAAPVDHIAVIHRRDGELHQVNYGGLRRQVACFAQGLVDSGHRPGERIAIAMPMTLEAVIAYLGIVAMGGVVVSIADSFAPHEVATRLRLTEAVTVVTQDRMLRRKNNIG
jgi:acetyl-CoA synthetase